MQDDFYKMFFTKSDNNWLEKVPEVTYTLIAKQVR